MSLISRLALSTVLLGSLAAPVMAQTTTHAVKHRATVTHHVTKAKPVAATTPATTTPATPAPAAATPAPAATAPAK